MEKPTLKNKAIKKETINQIRLTDQYEIKFTEGCPDPKLIGEKHFVIGELAKIFIEKNYGILC